MKLNFSMSTKPEKGATATTTAGTLDFGDLPEGTPKWLLYGFLSFAKVKLQGRFRALDSGIPSRWEGEAEALAPGAREVGVVVREMTPDEIQAALVAEARTNPAKRAELARLLAEMGDGE